MSFESLGLSEAILKAVREKGYTEPSAVQEKAIPAILEGRDVMAAAQTGTGKTAGFTLPLLERLAGGPSAGPNQVRALILTPTRELAAQVAASVETYGKHLPLRSAVVFGGVKINPQMMALRRGVDILVATPGRLLDLYQQNAVRFKFLEVLVLDEADRMLDMGFIRDIKKIISAMPKERQNLMFSATFSNEIRDLAKGMIHNPVEFSVTPRNTAVKSVTQSVIPVDKKQKPALLNHLIWDRKWEQVLVFSRTKHGANKLTRYLEDQGVKAAAIHGNKSQGARTKALADFKAGKVRVLVATDIAARGLDIDQLPQVVNFDLPNVSEDYVHRIGRTGRAGATGEAVSLVSADEFKLLSDIERLTQALIARENIEGFEPIHELPVSRLNSKPFKPKKPSSRGQNSNEGNNNRSRGAGKPGSSARKPRSAGSAKPTGARKPRRQDA
ncbi:MAG: ATP-dependent RNA helicase RhlE [Flavobacteriales bacterium]|jgi:ATP-dependent RNA helicase RhlE